MVNLGLIIGSNVEQVVLYGERKNHLLDIGSNK